LLLRSLYSQDIRSTTLLGTRTMQVLNNTLNDEAFVLLDTGCDLSVIGA